MTVPVAAGVNLYQMSKLLARFTVVHVVKSVLVAAEVSKGMAVEFDAGSVIVVALAHVSLAGAGSGGAMRMVPAPVAPLTFETRIRMSTFWTTGTTARAVYVATLPRVQPRLEAPHPGKTLTQGAKLCG